MLSSCLQGQTGPEAMTPGYGMLMAAQSGFYYVSGYPGGDPAPPYGAYTDFITPRFAISVLMAALDYRRRTGQGQYIDIAQYEASLHFLAPALIDYFANGRVLERRGNRSDRYAPHGAYRCRDEQGAERWISIAVGDDRDWQALTGVLGNPPCEERFATMLGRLENQSALDEFISGLVRGHRGLGSDRQAAASGRGGVSGPELPGFASGREPGIVRILELARTQDDGSGARTWVRSIGSVRRPIIRDGPRRRSVRIPMRSFTRCSGSMRPRSGSSARMALSSSDRCFRGRTKTMMMGGALTRRYHQEGVTEPFHSIRRRLAGRDMQSASCSV